MYDYYKPFRNFIRQFPVAEALGQIWFLASHLSGDGPSNRPVSFPDRPGLPLKLNEMIHLWDLELLAREVILNGSAKGSRSLAQWRDFSRAINFIRDIDNEVSRRWGSERTVLRELHRIIHRQAPWQRPASASSTMRYLKIFGGSELEPLLVAKTGLPLRKFFQLAFAVSGHLLREAGVNTMTNYSEIGVSPEESARFFETITAPLTILRERTKEAQRYDDGWLYAWNPLQATPLVSFDPHHPERALCPLPPYLLRRVTDGLFYDLVNLPGFDNAFGDAFQNYVGMVLRELLKLPRFDVSAEESYRVGKRYRKDGVDWTVMDDTANLFIECKTKRLRLDAKFILSGTGLHDAMDALGGYIVQHYKNIIDALAGKTRWQRNERPSFALITTLEDWWIFSPPVVAALDESVERHLAKANIEKQILTRVPYAVASIDEVELGCQIIAEVGIQPFFGAKAGSEFRGWSLSPFFQQEFPEEARRANRRLFADEFWSFGSGLGKPETERFINMNNGTGASDG
jgi:hypothetical protein